MKKILIISILLFSCKKQDVHVILAQKIILDGNSLAVGVGANGNGYRQLLCDVAPVSSLAISGQSTMSMLTNHADLDTALINFSVLVIDECTNDLYYGATAQEAYDHLQLYIDLVKTNTKVLIVTPTPRSNPQTPADFEAKRQELIRMIKSNKRWNIADVGSDPVLGSPGSELNTEYYCDKVHHTRKGYDRRGAIILDALRNINFKIYLFPLFRIALVQA